MITIDLNTMPHKIARRVIIAACARGMIGVKHDGAIYGETDGSYTKIYIVTTAHDGRRSVPILHSVNESKRDNYSLFRHLFGTRANRNMRDVWLDHIACRLAIRYTLAMEREAQAMQDGEFVTTLLKER